MPAEGTKARTRTRPPITTTTSCFSLPRPLLTQATREFQRAHPGARVTQRQAIDWAVNRRLPAIAAALTAHGFRAHVLGSPKPLRISIATLAALRCVADETGLSIAALLRACLGSTHA